MALTLAKTASGVMGNLNYWVGTATFDSSYATAGESLTAANLGLSEIYMLQLTSDQGATATESWLPVWDKSANKIQVFGGAGATTTDLDEAASGEDLSAYIVYVFALGPAPAL